LLALAQPWLVKTLIDEGLLAKDYQTLWHMAAIMIGAGLLGTVLAGVNRYLHTRLSGRILFALRDDLYRHLQQLSPTFYGRRRTGDILRGWTVTSPRSSALPWTRCSRRCRR
jgi:ATP-binding cassette subfamily B protein